MTYLDLLKSLLPRGIYTEDAGSLHVKDLTVEASALEAAQANADALAASEIFPDTADALLPKWESVFALNQTDKPLFQRQQSLLSAFSAHGSLTISGIQAALMPFIGYNAEVVEHAAFRADDPASLTDSGSYAMDEEYVYQFTVKIDNAVLQTVGYNPAMIQAVIDRIKPAHTHGVLDTGLYGFFCDDANSLTELTLLAL